MYLSIVAILVIAVAACLVTRVARRQREQAQWAQYLDNRLAAVRAEVAQGRLRQADGRSAAMACPNGAQRTVAWEGQL